MRRLLLPLALVLFLLSSCATVVDVDYLSPSEIDMGSYRNIALASTVAYRGFHEPGYYIRSIDDYALSWSHVRSSYDGSLATEVASHADSILINELSQTGFFNIIPPSVTDNLVELSRLGLSIRDEVSRLGIDAFLIPRIQSMDVNEYVSSEREFVKDYSRVDSDGEPLVYVRYRYYLTQTVTLLYSYTVIDAETMTVYATKNFSDKAEYTSKIDSPFFRGPDPVRYFDSMLGEMCRRAARQLAPYSSSLSVELMPNKPKLKAAEEGYDLVKDGNLAGAIKVFRSCWYSDSHLPSGYNYALLTAVMGDVDGAITILREIEDGWSDSDVRTLLNALQVVRNDNEEASRQLSGEESGISYTDSSNSIFSLVMGA